MIADVNGFRMRYELDGIEHGPVLVMAHSIGTSAELWQSQIADLGKSYRLVRIDFRGHGESAAPPGPYTIEMLGRDVLALLDSLGLESVDYVGLSLGGLVGQWLGANAPRRLRHLVLSNTSAYIGPREHWDTRIAAVAAHGLESVSDVAMRRWFSPGFIEGEPARVEEFKTMFRETSLSGYVATCEAIRDADHRSLVPHVAARTLVIAGTLDEVTTVDHGTWLADHIPGATLVSVAASHLSNVEAPGEFNAAVRDFLSS